MSTHEAAGVATMRMVIAGLVVYDPHPHSGTSLCRGSLSPGGQVACCSVSLMLGYR